MSAAIVTVLTREPPPSSLREKSPLIENLVGKYGSSIDFSNQVELSGQDCSHNCYSDD